MLDRAVQLPVREITGLHLGRPATAVLTNGVELNVLADPAMENVCEISVALEGGRVEARSEALASLAVSELRQGVSGLDAAAIADRIDTAGATLNNSLSTHVRAVHLTTLTRNAADNVELLARLVTEPTFPADIVERNKERFASQQEIRMQKPSYHASRLTARLVFGQEHPLAASQTYDEIMAITRDEIAAFHCSHMSAGGLRVFVSGNVSDALRDDIASRFACIQPNASAQEPLVLAPFEPSAPGVYTVDVPHCVQAAVMVTIPAIGRSHPDYIDLRLAQMALGGYFGSRLVTNIREDKGYTYGISAALLGYREGGMARIETSCDPSYIEGVLHETVAELRRMVVDPPRGEELLRLQRTARMSLASTLDSAITRMNYITEGFFGGYDAVDYFARQVKAIDALTPDRLAEVAERYLQPDKAIVAVASADADNHDYKFN